MQVEEDLFGGKNERKTGEFRYSMTITANKRGGFVLGLNQNWFTPTDLIFLFTDLYVVLLDS